MLRTRVWQIHGSEHEVRERFRNVPSPTSTPTPTRYLTPCTNICAATSIANIRHTPHRVVAKKAKESN